jgi:hypothetical protein
MDDSIRFADLENPRMVENFGGQRATSMTQKQGLQSVCVCVSTEGEKGRSMGWSALPSLGENG